MSEMFFPNGVSQLVHNLVAISREYGANPEYVLAGGGNTSVKDGDDLYVKASGTQLGTIDADGFVHMSRKSLNEIWTKKYPEDADAREEAVLADMMNSRVLDNDSRRPSVESLLHNLFPHRYVVHTHPSLVNGITCSVQNEAAATRIFGDEAVWLPVIDPGYILALQVKKAVDIYSEKKGKFPQLVLLQNHGIFVAADSEDEIRDIYDKVFGAIRDEVTVEPVVECKIMDNAQSTALCEKVAQAVPGSHSLMFSNSDIDGIINDATAFSELKMAVTPDHIVYCGYRPLFIDNAEELEQQISNFDNEEGFPPRIIAIINSGIIACHSSSGKAELARQLFLDNVKIAVYSRSFGGIQFMPEENVNFIRTWEVEKYRASQSK